MLVILCFQAFRPNQSRFPPNPAGRRCCRCTRCCCSDCRPC
ncbi:hypothetical protein HMPREF1545_04031 [Oscillibacter sp. KLE 1728]|nr:hypothetical protein HMPREF1545_04031 [Oscillibacter sp. KLE 1728]